MHVDEVDTDAALARRLVAAQFPQWAGLEVEAVERIGTSNAMFRLGADMVVRLPRRAGAAKDIDMEHEWLPRLGAQLPTPIPVPLAQGTPQEGYPWRWSVYEWLDGTNPVVGRLTAPKLLATDLAAFVTTLRRTDPADGPASYRSEPLPQRDADTRRALADVRDLVDQGAALSVWESALRAPEWTNAPVWIHSDLQPGNLLVSPEGRLSAVIDFECAGFGDAAVDLLPAWYVLPPEARALFRTVAEVDEATWVRGRGWALSVALLELSYYRHSNPVMVATAQHVLDEILAEG
ncbi:phosphotransferase [Streptacidiphilus pinicola]|uniref:Phosphotransferase n=2 Tax=Streptacidiphilus pinicola TaxID=2219663 RepID=A0A2X0I9I7_9ACTN|nr:phosphotransferase [Streptacidiphilus pinicola]